LLAVAAQWDWGEGGGGGGGANWPGAELQRGITGAGAAVVRAPLLCMSPSALKPPNSEVR
jgi:hypothetical protein